MNDKIQLQRFEFLKSFVQIYGFSSLCDFKTEISIKELKKNDTLLERINAQMDVIRELFPMSLFNLKRKDYTIDTENLAIKVLRKCLECSNITYEHIHRQSGNILRLNPPNLLYMKYIIHNMEHTQMKDLIHGLEMEEINKLFESKEISTSEFLKKVCFTNQPQGHQMLSRECLKQPQETKTLHIPISKNMTNMRVRIFDYLNEFCVINSMLVDYKKESIGGRIKLTCAGHELVAIDDCYTKTMDGKIEITRNLCSYEYPLPLSILSTHKSLDLILHAASGYDNVIINYTEITNMNLEYYKKLFCEQLVIHTNQTFSFEETVTVTQLYHKLPLYLCEKADSVVTNIRCLIIESNRLCSDLVKSVDLCIDGIVINTINQSVGGEFIFDFKGQVLSPKKNMISLVINFIKKPQSEIKVIYMHDSPYNLS